MKRVSRVAGAVRSDVVVPARDAIQRETVA